MAGSELVALDAWVDTRLRTSLTLRALVGNRIFDRFAPTPGYDENEVQYPFVIWQSQSTGDVNMVGGHRVLFDAVYIVKAVAPVDSYAALADEAAALDAALLTPPGTTAPDGRTLSCQRIEQFALTEIDNGEQFRHFGGMYRIQMSA